MRRLLTLYLSLCLAFVFSHPNQSFADNKSYDYSYYDDERDSDKKDKSDDKNDDEDKDRKDKSDNENDDEDVATPEPVKSPLRQPIMKIRSLNRRVQ
ncbi:MAG: hypothetical protein R8M46_02945 [Ghiorsea sp.]